MAASILPPDDFVISSSQSNAALNFQMIDNLDNASVASGISDTDNSLNKESSLQDLDDESCIGIGSPSEQKIRKRVVTDSTAFEACGPRDQNSVNIIDSPGKLVLRKHISKIGTSESPLMKQNPALPGSPSFLNGSPTGGWNNNSTNFPGGGLTRNFDQNDISGSTLLVPLGSISPTKSNRIRSSSSSMFTTPKLWRHH